MKFKKWHILQRYKFTELILTQMIFSLEVSTVYLQGNWKFNCSLCKIVINLYNVCIFFFVFKQFHEKAINYKVKWTL